jgi:hypothetical protein
VNPDCDNTEVCGDVGVWGLDPCVEDPIPCPMGRVLGPAILSLTPFDGEEVFICDVAYK